jgi:hypothetical protein
LKAKKLTAYDPGGQIAELIADARRGGMSADAYVSWRQNLGREAMKGGNEGAAASAIIDATNNSSLLTAGAQYRDLVNKALADGRALHKKIAADPAYNAVVSGKASSDNFLSKYVVGTDSKSLGAMKANLASDPIAQQTMASGVVNHLRSSAGVIGGEGNFSQAGYNRALEKIRPKLSIVFEPEQRQQLETLGNVARTVQAQPVGSFVNNSNTFVSAVADRAAGVAEAGANAIFGGKYGIPVGSMIRNFIGKTKAERAASEALGPGAGIALRDIKP